MRLPGAIRQLVRERAGFACEYCGVREQDSAAELTVDHFRPRSQGGDDALGNLVYSCHFCNTHKADYWPASPEELPLWNPRDGPSSDHFLSLEDGRLFPISAVGAFSIDRLNLNRPVLIEYRLAQRRIADQDRTTTAALEVLAALRVLKEDLRDVVREQRELLQELRHWLEQRHRD